MKERFYIFLFFLFLASGSYAQNKLAGLVLNNEDAPVVGAIVAILNKETNKITHSITTDSLGEFSFSSCPDDIRLSVAAFGYEAYMSDVPVRQYVDSKMEVRLKNIMLGEVVVTATAKPRMQRDGNKLVVDKLENSPHAKSNDVFTFMRFIPALKVPTFEGNITLQETGGGNAVLLVNGKNINIPMDAYLKNIRAEDIERIEIVAYPMGEYKVRNGESVINLVLKRREDEGFQYNLFLADKQAGVNGQNGSFSVSHAGRKTDITSGIFVNNARGKQEKDNNYRYYDNGQEIIEASLGKEKALLLSGYLNLDYELNKKNTLGLRIGVNGDNMDNVIMAETQYGKLAESVIDSVYFSQTKAYSPFKLTRINSNVNYTTKTDSKGSTFFADLDYIMSRPQSDTHNIFDKKESAEKINKTDVLQNNRTHIDGYSVWVRYNHIFTPTTRLSSGVTFSTANSRYDYFYGNKESGDYINDLSKTNCFFFDDYTFTAYTTLHHKWSNKLTTVTGLRVEAYGGNGDQKTTNEQFSRHDFDFLPSFMLNYVPSDNHRLIVSVSSNINRPSYYTLNPFKMFISPTTYTKGNQAVKSYNSYFGNLGYTFFKNYKFNGYMLYQDNIFGDYTTSDENGLNMISPLNCGKRLVGTLAFSADRTLLNGYLYLSGRVSYSFGWLKYNIENVDNYTDKSLSSSLSTNVTISKKKMLSTYISYYYTGSFKGVGVCFPHSHRIEVSLSKRFNASSLSLGIAKPLDRNRKSFYEQQNYGYTVWNKNYWYFNLSYSITFGNKKTQSVENRANDDMNSRFAK